MSKKTNFKGNESLAQMEKALTDTILRYIPAHTLIGTLSATDQKRIFVAPTNLPTGAKVYIQEVYLVTETGDAIDGTDYWSFQIVNVTDTENLLSSAMTNYTGGTAITADTPYAMGVDQNNNLDPGDVLEIQATKTGSADNLNECSVVVVYSFDTDDAD